MEIHRSIREHRWIYTQPFLEVAQALEEAQASSSFLPHMKTDTLLFHTKDIFEERLF